MSEQDFRPSHAVPPRYLEAVEVRKSLGASPKSLESVSQTLMVAEALKRGINVERRWNKPGLRFSHAGQSHVWRGNGSTLNSSLAKQLTTYKDIQSRVFLNHGIQAPENAVFSPGDEWRAWAWGQSFGTLVVKPHDGTQGQNVHVGITNWKDFSYTFNSVARRTDRVLVEKFHTGTEHRFFVVDNKVAGVIRRRPASVIGDGTSTITELAREKNADRGVIHKPVPLGPNQLRYLHRNGYTSDSVPEDGQRVYVHGMSNLHAGGDAINADQEVSAEEIAVVEDASRVIPGLRLGGFDVLLPREPGDVGRTVIEVNHWAMVSMHHFPWEGDVQDVAARIFDAMFPVTSASLP